jgi:putative tricarboxylic transport membrane protein
MAGNSVFIGIQEITMKKGLISIGIFGIALSGFIWLYTAIVFPPEPGVQFGSAVVPRFLAVVMTVLCLILIFQTVQKNTQKTPFEFSLRNPAFKRVLITLLSCVIFGSLLKILGFIICAVILLSGLMYMLGNKKPLWILMVSVTTAVVVQLTFENLLGIMLPYGILDFMFMLF